MVTYEHGCFFELMSFMVMINGKERCFKSPLMYYIGPIHTPPPLQNPYVLMYLVLIHDLPMYV
jgi:hypothetical protein